jgi:hypothetical protein
MIFGPNLAGNTAFTALPMVDRRCCRQRDRERAATPCDVTRAGPQFANPPDIVQGDISAMAVRRRW